MLTETARMYDALMSEVVDDMTAAERAICQGIAQMEARQQATALRELSDELVLIIQRSPDAASYVQVGFPFPLLERPVAARLPMSGYALRLCLRGERVRELQHEALHASLGFTVSTVSTEEFADTCRRLACASRSCLYINPYGYLGDSFIGTYFRDRMTLAYRLPADGYYTRFVDDLYAVRDARPLATAIGDVTASHLAVLPDLIDTHFSDTLDCLQAIVRVGAPVLLIGRNTAVDSQARRVYRTHESDPLLRSSNIEDYMDDCLSPFLGGCPPPARPTHLRLPTLHQEAVFVNPFGSVPKRDLPPGLVLNIVAALDRLGVPRVVISKGSPDVEKDEIASAAIADGLSHLRLAGEACQRGFDSLGHLTHELADRNVTLGISPDTSIPHLFNALGIPVLTFYGLGSWDGACVQSLASDSPLGFCRYCAGQLPLLFDRAAIPPVDLLQRALGEIVSCDRPDRCAETLLDAYWRAISALATIEETGMAGAFDELADLHERLAAAVGLDQTAGLFDARMFRPWLVDLNGGRTRRLVQSLFRISPVFKIAEACRGAAQP
jgi:hypothetical protein